MIVQLKPTIFWDAPGLASWLSHPKQEFERVARQPLEVSFVGDIGVHMGGRVAVTCYQKDTMKEEEQG